MGLMDKVRAQGTQLAQRAQDTAREGKVKLDQAQAKRRADAMFRDLGATVYAERTGRPANVGVIGVALFRERPSVALRITQAEKASEAARDFRFAHAGRADHQNILGKNVFGEFRSKLLAPDTVAQRNRHGLLRRVLPDDIFI